jgi:uncharacterized protein with HEPN domain
MQRDDLVLCRHIIDAAREAVALTAGTTVEGFAADRKLDLAVVRLLEIIGEASRSVSRAFRETHSDIPWTRMIGMRDRLIHAYWDINREVVWKTVSEDLPPLIAKVESLLPSS